MSAASHVKRVSRYTALSRDEFMALEVPAISYLVDGILVSGSATLFSAREKAGKGLFLIDLAMCVATGTPFLDRAVMEGPAIYLALEENVATIQSRLAARDKGHGGYPFYVVRLDGSVDGEEFYLDSEDGITGLAELIDTIQPVLVIIDPLREAHRGRENESDDMAPRLRAIRSLSHQTNTAIVVSHHAGKMSGTFRGSTAIRASFDDELQFTREDTDTDADVRGTLRAEGRNLQRVVEHVAFNSSDFRWVVTGEPPLEIAQNMRHRILAVLNTGDTWMDAKDIAAAIPGAKLRTIQNELSKMFREKPRPFAVDREQASKSDPRRYHTIQRREMVHSDVVNQGVNDESPPQNVKPFRSGAPRELNLAAGEEVF